MVKPKTKTTRTRRVSGKKKKNEPTFHLGLKTALLLSSIVVIMVVMILLSNWSSGQRSLQKEISMASAQHEVEMNNLTYKHEGTMKDLQQDIETLESEIDDLKLQIAIVKGERELRNNSN